MFPIKILKTRLGLIGVSLLVLALPAFARSAARAQGQPPSDEILKRREALRTYALEHQGSPEAGRKLFFAGARPGCSGCHMICCVGGKLGPDLTRIGAKLDKAELIMSVLDPSQRIAEGYQRVTVETVDGRRIRGTLLQQTSEFVEVKSGSQVVRVAQADIERLELDPISDMPEGLADDLSPAQFADLIAFLESRK